MPAPEDVMQACLEAGDLPGTPCEVRAINLAFDSGVAAAKRAVYSYAGPESPWHQDLMRRIDRVTERDDRTVDGK